MAFDQARLAVDTRAFPLLIHDLRKGDTIKKRLSLQGNPAVEEGWWKNRKTKQTFDFIGFCRSKGRFSQHFDKDGHESMCSGTPCRTVLRTGVRLFSVRSCFRCESML